MFSGQAALAADSARKLLEDRQDPLRAFFVSLSLTRWAPLAECLARKEHQEEELIFSCDTQLTWAADTSLYALSVLS